MDSGNSGSMQSSSGGDEEYDSRPESFLNPLPAPAPPHPTIFAPLPNYADTFRRSRGFDMAWAGGLRPDPHCTGAGASLLPSSSAAASYSFQTTSPSVQLAAADRSLPSAGDQPHRGSKKRSRASRRAPTTVLTTDTSNFRAMVQEFTGIPAPPFSTSSFPGTRLDLFAGIRSDRSPTAPPYLRRPFAKKIHPLSSSLSPPSSTVAAMIDALSSRAASNAAAAAYSTPLFTFPSLLPSLPAFSTKPQPEANLDMGILECFTTANVASLPGLPSSDGTPARSGVAPNWPEVAANRDADQTVFRPFNGSSENLQLNVSNSKLNFSSSSTDLRAEKGRDSVASRGEGMVDSWISSSD